MLTLVRFVLSAPPYNAGETAGFTEADAQALVDRGVAVRLNEAEVKKLRAPKPVAKVPAAPELVLVRFLNARSEDDPKPPVPFIGGETAAFSPEIAAKFIDAGVAELADEPATVAPTAGAPAPGKPVKVVFVGSARGHKKGEGATFPEAEAKELIKQGLAVLPGDAPTKPEPTKAGEGVDVLGKTDRAGLEPLGAGSGSK